MKVKLAILAVAAMLSGCSMHAMKYNLQCDEGQAVKYERTGTLFSTTEKWECMK